MDTMIRTSTIDDGYTDGAPGGACTALQTTLYDLMQAMQDAAGPDAEDLVVDAVVQLLRRGRIRFISQPAHPVRTGLYEVFPRSA